MEGLGATVQAVTGAGELGAPQSSNQRAIQGIAREILRRAVGERLETTLHYQQRMGVGAGTVQKALGLMQTTGAARLRAAGHQGTFVEERHLGRLWNLSGLGHVRLVFTPPGAVEHHALATGLTEELERLGIPAGLRFVRGAQRRVAMVMEGRAEVAVMSKGAAENIRPAPGSGGLRLFDLGRDTFYGEGSMLVVTRRSRDRPPARIGIDRSSYDHEQLTRAEFPEDAGHIYVDCDFPHVPAAILADRIDAGVWHRMLLLIPPDLAGLATRQLSRPAALGQRARLSNAVLAYRADNEVLASILAELDIGAIRAHQEYLSSFPPESEELQARIWLR